MAFTMVFEGDIREFKGNPFKTETPFGIPLVVAVGDIIAEADALREEADQGVTEEIGRLKAENERLRKGIQDYLDGNYGLNYPGIKVSNFCINEHFTALLSPSPFPSVSGGE